eukprot:Gb_27115 [translate_table: standard]
MELRQSTAEKEEGSKDGSVDFKGRPARTATTGGWKASLFIMAVESSERMAYFAIISNLITYLTNVLHEGLAISAKNVNNWLGVTTVLPLVGGFLADAYVGQYWMVVVTSIIYLLGLSLLIIAVSISALKPPPCPPNRPVCGNGTSAEIGVLFVALYIISVGAGGHKPSVGSYGPDQFDEHDPKERLQKMSFFNWFFWAVSCGIVLASTVVVYVEENVSWGAGFGFVTAAFAISIAVFLYGTPLYRNKVPAGSPITRIVQVLVAAARNRNLQLPLDETLIYEDSDLEFFKAGGRQLEHTDNFEWLDKAAVQEVPVNINSEGKKTNHWKLCTVTQVEEVKQILRMVPIWLSCLTFAVVLTQESTFFIKQSGTMDRSMGSNFKLPRASVLAFGIITMNLFLPLYDRVLVPLARTFTGNERGITILQRIGVGMFISIVGMVVAALVDGERLQTARINGLLDKPHATIPLTVFWLTPQYILTGIADGFALVGLREYFYSEVPDTMRNLAVAISMSVVGVGSFLCSILITIIEKVTERVSSTHHSWFVNNMNRCHLDYFFWFLAILSTINLCMFVYFAHGYRYKKALEMKHRPNTSTTAPHLENGLV